MSRTPLIAGNWKMHKTAGEARAFLAQLQPLIADVPSVDVAIAAPFTALHACVEVAQGTGIQIYAQNMHEEPSGAFTGEVSAAMLVDLEVDGVILGHSERRGLFCETDKALQQKVPRALESDLLPILCVGETEAERDAGDTERRLRHQVQEGLHNVPDDRLAEVIIAYEPVWAIGTGNVATPEQAQEACGFVRALVSDRSKEAGEAVRVLYGGSMKPDNAAELLALEDIDGGLIGGASLEPDQLAAIIRAAAAALR